MKKSLSLLLLAMVLVSCAPKAQEHDAIQEAIIGMLSKTSQNADRFRFTEYECFDTVSLDEAIVRSMDIHRKKSEAAVRNAERFRSERKRTNAARQDSIAAFSNAAMRRISFLKDSLEADLQKPLYYCVRFGGSTFLRENNLSITRLFVTVGSDGAVYNVQEKETGLHNGMGILIPGYRESLDNLR